MHMCKRIDPEALVFYAVQNTAHITIDHLFSIQALHEWSKHNRFAININHVMTVARYSSFSGFLFT